jgi:hypothetical protein
MLQTFGWPWAPLMTVHRAAAACYRCSVGLLSFVVVDLLLATATSA